AAATASSSHAFLYSFSFFNSLSVRSSQASDKAVVSGFSSGVVSSLPLAFAALAAASSALATSALYALLTTLSASVKVKSSILIGGVLVLQCSSILALYLSSLM